MYIYFFKCLKREVEKKNTKRKEEKEKKKRKERNGKKRRSDRVVGYVPGARVN
jgi:protein subunit release factor A